MTGSGAHPLLDERAVERLLTRRTGPAEPDLQRAVALVRTLADAPAPPPTAALAQLLDHGFEPTVVPFRRPAGRRRRLAARTGAAVTAAAASLLVAGTAAALPPGLQGTVADVVSALTPFELPRPAPAVDDGDAPDRIPPGDGATAPADPGPSAVPTPSAPVTTGPAARATGGDDRDDREEDDREDRREVDHEDDGDEDPPDRRRPERKRAADKQLPVEAEDDDADDSADELADEAEDAATRSREDTRDEEPADD